MSGLSNSTDGIANEDTLRKNLAVAVPLLEEAKVVGLIEPINGYSVPAYFLNSFELGKSFWKYIFIGNWMLQDISDKKS